MSKSEELSRKTRRMIAKNLIVLAALAVVIVIGVSSWFTLSGGNAAASGVSVECAIPEGLEVCIVDPDLSPENLQTYLNDDNHWKSESFTITDTEYPFLATLNLADITGDGMSFIAPPIYQIGTVATVRNTKQGDETDAEFSTKWSTGNIQTYANIDYMSIDLYFRTAGSGKKVVLNSNTYFGPNNEDLGNSVAGFSPDAVIGAARMAIYDSDLAERKLLWVPAPHLYFDGVNLFTEKYKTDNDLLDTNNTYGLFYTQNNIPINLHTDGTYNHGYYTADKQRHKIMYNATPGAGVTANNRKDYRLHTDVDLATFPTAQTTYNGKSYYAASVRMNVWVEGEDPESRSDQISGKFKSILNLTLSNAG